MILRYQLRKKRIKCQIEDSIVKLGDFKGVRLFLKTLAKLFQYKKDYGMQKKSKSLFKMKTTTIHLSEFVLEVDFRQIIQYGKMQTFQW